MTREEIVSAWEFVEDGLPFDALESKDNRVDMHELIHSTIEALSAEPCDDCISRKATLEPYRVLKDTDTLCVALIRANIRQQPSVTPKQKMGRWIPVSERLPEPYGQVLRTVKSIGWNGTFSIYVDIGTICPIDTDVIAWMPLPEPYKEQLENERKGEE